MLLREAQEPDGRRTRGSYTVLVHADNPGTWAWHCDILSHAENDQCMFGMVRAMVVK